MKKEEWIVSPEELKKNRERALLRDKQLREEKKDKRCQPGYNRKRKWL